MAILLNQAKKIISTHSEPGGASDETEPDMLQADANETRRLQVTEDGHGQRLDRVLAQKVPEFSRSYLQQLIAEQAVQVNGKLAAKQALRLRAGDVLDIELRPTAMSQAFTAQDMPLTVLYEDAHLRIVDKPAGLVVHPAPGHWSGTLLNGLLALDPAAARLPRAGIVHRLDKDTSGLLVVARTRAAMDGLVELIASRQMRRQYLALAHKPWRRDQQVEVDAPIGRDVRNRLRMAVVDLQQHPGKTACTRVQWLADAQQGCLLRCELVTGRTHQIRVHMAHLGHPLVGDALYGGTPAAGMQRQALHARRLAFTHPITGQAVDMQAPLPADLQAALQAWGLTMEQEQKR